MSLEPVMVPIPGMSAEATPIRQGPADPWEALERCASALEAIADSLAGIQVATPQPSQEPKAECGMKMTDIQRSALLSEAAVLPARLGREQAWYADGRPRCAYGHLLGHWNSASMNYIRWLLGLTDSSRVNIIGRANDHSQPATRRAAVIRAICKIAGIKQVEL